MTSPLPSKKLSLSWQNCSAILPQDKAEQDAWLIQLMSQQQHQDYALWFDSTAAAHDNSRFHILLKQPDFYLQASDQGSEIKWLNPALEIPSLLAEFDPQTPFLTAAKQLHNKLQQQVEVAVHQDIPFNGGFAGYLSYDLGRQLEQLPQSNAVEYQTPIAGLGFYTTALVLDKQQQQLWLLAPSKQHQSVLQSWLNPDNEAQPRSSAIPFKLTSTWRSNMQRSEYQQRFAQVREFLLAGDCYQINLAQRYSASYEGSEWQAYLRIRQQNAAPFSAFMRLPQGCLLSVSPERFLAVNSNQQVETKPIKGTRPRFADPAADRNSREALKQSAKDQAENLMIVDLLRNDLSRSCLPDSIEVPHLFAIESFPAVHHLVSTIRGQLDPQKSVFELYQGAFPGGSITGAPKVRAMQIIEQLEPNRRNIYCGSMVYFSLCGSSDSSITIRTLLAEANQLYCWAGGGLVIDSNESDEYQETLDKVARILPILEQSS